MVKTKNAALNFIIAGDPSGAQKAMRTVSVEADGLGGKLKTLGGVLTAGAVIRWGQQTIDTYRRVGGEQLKLMRLTGTTEEQASGLWVAAQQSGLGVDKLSAAIGILSTKIRSGATEQLGLDLTDASGKALPLDESLRRIADRVAGMADGAEKNSLVRALFGRSGTDLLPLLNKGGAALDEMITKAEELGLVLDADSIRQATRNQRDFQLATTAAGYVIGKELLPVATAFTAWASRELPRVVGFVSTVTDAFGALPGPIRATVLAAVAIGPAVKVLGMVVAPVKMIGSALVSGARGAKAFALGLTGIATEGGGAAASAGRLVATLGPVGVAGAVAGVGLVAAGLNQVRLEAERAKRNVDLFRAGLDEGMTPYQQMVDMIAKTLSQTDGGFSSLSGSSKQLKADLEDLGVSVPDLARLLTGSDKDWAAFQAKVAEQLGVSQDRIDALLAGGNEAGDTTRNEERFRRIIENLEVGRTAAAKAADSWQSKNQILKEAGYTYDETTGSITRTTEAVEEQTTALDRAKSAIDTYMGRMNAIHDAETAVVDAHRASTDAQEQLAEARRAATGDSDEYRSAVQSVRDAEESVRDAQEQVADAQRGVTEAQEDLNDARAEARDRLREMSEAARDAALAEEDANLKVRESRDELRRTLADPRATALEKERARLDVKRAEEDARQAADDNRDAQEKNKQAQAAGVEGDERVVDARRRVADANRKVTEAEQGVADARRGVAEAERRAAKVISDARAEVAEAQRRAEDAMVKEAQAWGELASAQNGSVAGMVAYRDQLAKLAGDLDPASPLARRVVSLIADLDEAIRLGRLASSGTAVTPPTRDPDRGAPPGQPGRGGNGAGGEAGGNVVANTAVINVTVQGTSRDQLRQMEAQSQRIVDRLARRTR